MASTKKVVIGLTQKVVLKGKKRRTVMAKIDTGATKSSIDIRLAKELGLGPVIKEKKVKSAQGSGMRPIIECSFELAKKKMRREFTLADRSHMKYSVLIGQNALKEGFMIDPSIE